MVKKEERKTLEKLYAGRKVLHGELHDHADTGGTSDGKYNLSQWIDGLKELKMDFATILDHRQVRHMYLPEWEEYFFIGGTEPGTIIEDSKAEKKNVHYNMIFSSPKQLESLLEKFTEFEFTGGKEGHFIYPSFTRERFCQIIDEVKALGGFFVHPHPKQLMISDNPCDYWFQDQTGIEVFYVDMAGDYTKENYKLWTDLLAAGKKVWACAGGDKHREPIDTALTTIYAEERNSKSVISHLREGDFTCGSAGIRSCIGDTRTGGQCNFAGEKLIVAVGDFHDSVKSDENKYRVDIINDKGLVLSQEIGCQETSYLSIDTEECNFYRVEVFDQTRDLRIAIGNPIWRI